MYILRWIFFVRVCVGFPTQPTNRHTHTHTLSHFLLSLSLSLSPHTRTYFPILSLSLSTHTHAHTFPFSLYLSPHTHCHFLSLFTRVCVCVCVCVNTFTFFSSKRLCSISLSSQRSQRACRNLIQRLLRHFASPQKPIYLATSFDWASHLIEFCHILGLSL